MATVKKNVSGAAKRPARPSQPPTDFIALGAKPKDHRGHGNDNAAPYRALPIKKPKPSGPATQHHQPMSALSRLAAAAESVGSRMSPTIPDSTVPCIDCSPPDLVYKVLKYIDTNGDQVEGLLCGAIHHLRLNRLKPDSTIVLSLLYLAKIHPEIFNNENIIESLCGLLKKDVGHDYIKSKTNNIVAIVACNILMSVLEKDESWPALIVRVFLDDSVGERIWVDHLECLQFVKNIQTAFGTKIISREEKEDKISTPDAEAYDIKPRFDDILDSIQNLTVDIVKERLSRRQADNSVSVGVVAGPGTQSSVGLMGKHLIKTLVSACGMQEVRTMAIQKLEVWLQNPKLLKPAQDLLYAICVNCNTHLQEDVDVIGQMTKIRLKSKMIINHYNLCIKELIEAHPDNLKTLFSYVLYNELSNARNQSNMAVITSALQNYPEAAAKTLASVCQDLLLQQEDYLRAVRALLREIVKSSKHSIRFNALALGLMQEPDMEKYQQLDQNRKDRYISSTSDLICLTMLLSVTPQAKEAMHVLSGKKKTGDSFVSDVEATYAQFKQTLAEIQHDSLWWVHVIVQPSLTKRMVHSEYIQLIHKVLFMKAPDSYHTRDNWPPDSERAFMIKSCHDSPVLEGSLLRIAAIGLSQDHPLAPPDALELINQLIRRAASLSRPGFNPLVAERVDLIDTILALCQYHHPGNIRLPTEYVPPSLAISQLYWGALQSLLVIASLNSTTVGHQAWTNYPMLKVFMEMTLVNRFSYPPVTVVDEDVKNKMISKEHQMALVEKSEILEFESHLAAATTHLVVTEESSLLLSQLIAMDSQGHSRRPPDRILEQMGQLSSHLQLGIWLCRSRQPDFLLEIINRHGENQSMSWLPDLVASSKGDVGLLPVQCLCEFLLVHDSESEKLSSGGIHISELISQLRKLLLSDNLEDSLQVKQYFLKRLYSPQKVMRERARNALALVLNNDSEVMEVENTIDRFRWLLLHLPQLPHYASVIRPHAVEAIQAAALIESDPICVVAYVKFLANDLCQFPLLNEESHGISTSYTNMTSSLLIDRRIIVEAAISLTDEKLLPDDQTCAAEMFLVSLLQIYLIHLRQAQEQDLRRRLASEDGNEDRMPWSDSQDEIYVKWPNNFGAATLNILVPQASIILLGFGAPTWISAKNQDSQITIIEHDTLYDELMGLWFSEEGYIIPQAYLMDTQEEALLTPDWLRLRMLRSEAMPSTRRLAFAAVRDLEVEQLILFVQSFGIPVESMNLLLEILDSQCESNANVILNATRTNTSYMSRLIDVQEMRGCKAGSKFAQLLKSVSDGSTQSKAEPSCVIDLIDDSSDSAMDVETVLPSQLKPPQNTTDMKTTLKQFFSPGGGHSEGWSILLQSVNQVKGPNNLTAILCITSLHDLVLSDTGLDFISCLYDCPSRACCLLRALSRAVCSPRRLTKQKIINKFQKVVEQIHVRGINFSEKIGSRSQALLTLTSSWQLHRDPSKGGHPRRMSSTSEQSSNLRQSDWSRLEEFLRDQLAFLDKDEEIKAKVSLVAQILLEDISHRRVLMSRGQLTHNDDYFTSIGTTGLLVDWLQLLDPELLVHTPHLQRKLLFEGGRNSLNTLDVKVPVFDQAYLLSLLAEHCNWENIHNSLQWLLSDATPDLTVELGAGKSDIVVDAKAALDFLWVIIQAPKIWQGRENKSTSVSEPVLQLTSSQFYRLLSYVVAATVGQEVNDLTPQLENSAAPGKGGPTRTSYVDLFGIYFSKFGQSRCGKTKVCEIAKFLVGRIQSTSKSSPCCPVWWKLLAQLYVIQPNIPVWNSLETEDFGFSSEDMQKFSDIVSTIKVASNCRTDALICSLLNRLGYVRSKSTFDNRMGSSIVMSNLDSAYDANLALTKLASSKPFLILRQLPLLSSMLRGRTRHEFFEFKVQHHLPLMFNSVTILRHLIPYIFRPMHAAHVYEIVELFWQMLRNYCHRARRQMLPVLLKTLNFTHEYLSRVPLDATKILTKHHATFQMLLKTYHDQENIVPLVGALQSAISTHVSSSGDVMTSVAMTSVVPQTVPVTSVLEQPNPLYMELLIHSQDLENVKQVLADFDESSKRRIDNIVQFVPELRKIFSRSLDPAARKSALAAAIRFARQSPTYTEKDLFPEYISCLREHSRVREEESKSKFTSLSTQFTATATDDWSSLSLSKDSKLIAREALQFLPDMTILCRERANMLLGAAFDVGARNGGAICRAKTIGGDHGNENSDVTDLLAKSIWLLAGYAESDMKPVAAS
ncbi:integrator complex subunit 1-like [Clavelina lepadiformis]|uniref:integrator complex subunit 1-like n=1 Tax=Clavelina lepadiformis TaxID=159417 RepID=UPI004041DCF8